MCVKRRCPVPDKSARCQSIRPVRVSLPGDPARGVPSWRDGSQSDRRHPWHRHALPQGSDRDLTASKQRSGRINWHEVLSNAVSGPTQTTAGTLIACHSIRPAQVGAAIAGRLIWHRTAEQCPQPVQLESVPGPDGMNRWVGILALLVTRRFHARSRDPGTRYPMDCRAGRHRQRPDRGS